MTQRIFKKSNKQDMIDLFNILPDEIKHIEKKRYSKEDIRIELCTIIKLGNISIPKVYTDCDFNGILNIDFETDNIEEMIIKRTEEI